MKKNATSIHCGSWSTILLALAMFPGALTTVHASTKTFANVSGTDWNTTSNWGGPLPVAGDEVTINGNVLMTNSPPALASYTLNSGKTHTVDGWNTVLTSTVVTLAGTLTHTNNLATTTNAFGVWIPNARVSIVCSNLTINSAGKIDVNGKGFGGGKLNLSSGYGPGRGAGSVSAGGGEIQRAVAAGTDEVGTQHAHDGRRLDSLPRRWI